MLGSSMIYGEVWHCSPLLLKPVCIAWCCDLYLEREIEWGHRNDNRDVRKLTNRWGKIELHTENKIAYNSNKALNTVLPFYLQILSDLGTYLHKAIPDTRLTIRRYADAKFEYLSYCLKVKEMDDEEMQFAHLQEPLYRIETGNYEYR